MCVKCVVDGECMTEVDFVGSALASRRLPALVKTPEFSNTVPGGIKRLSVAVLLREEPGKPRGKVEIDQITQLVRAAVGFDPNRGDNVTVISRKFTAGADAANSSSVAAIP
mgnify:CR=1 FL=1